MLHLFSDLRGFAIQAEDGRKGSVDDIYFDADAWTVRYIAADIGPIFFGRKALIGRDLLMQPDLKHHALPIALSKAQVENTPEPGPKTAEPVSAREERRIRERNAEWPAFLLGPEGAAYTPVLAEQQIGKERKDPQSTDQIRESKTTLRSMAEIRGYKVRAQDDWIGTVYDFVIDPLDWQVRYVAIDTGDWLSGKRVVVAVGRLSGIDWHRGEINVKLSRQQVETNPSIDSVSELKRSDEYALFA